MRDLRASDLQSDQPFGCEKSCKNRKIWIWVDLFFSLCVSINLTSTSSPSLYAPHWRLKTIAVARTIEFASPVSQTNHRVVGVQNRFRRFGAWLVCDLNLNWLQLFESRRRVPATCGSYLPRSYLPKLLASHPRVTCRCALLLAVVFLR